MRDVERGLPCASDTVFRIYSMTKAVTSVALMQLVEEGLIALDDPVARHIPAFAAGGKETITIRHLLTHTGGFRAAPGMRVTRMGPCSGRSASGCRAASGTSR